jgi:hypothetical protein
MDGNVVTVPIAIAKFADMIIIVSSVIQDIIHRVELAMNAHQDAIHALKTYTAINANLATIEVTANAKRNHLVQSD